MPLYPIPHEAWQQLRRIKRANGQPVPGRAVRVKPSRWTKSGEFLNELVAAGLIVRAGAVPPESTASFRLPAEPFRFSYLLTEAGERAAEFGEIKAARYPFKMRGAKESPKGDS